MVPPTFYSSLPQVRLTVMGAGELPSQSALCADSSPRGRAETWLPLWGRRCPVGTVLRRPSRQVRRCHRIALTERASLKLGGFSKGGALAPPFGIKLYNCYPLPCRQAILLRTVSAWEGAGGGHRSSRARLWVRPGVGRLAPQANKIPPQRAFRDFQLL